jgi:hypothetical protein
MNKNKGFSFQEIAITFIVAAIIASIAVVSYRWLYTDTEEKALLLKATQFEQSARSISNIEVVAPNSVNLDSLISELVNNNYQIIEKNGKYEISYNGNYACVTLGAEVNEKGGVVLGVC